MSNNYQEMNNTERFTKVVLGIQSVVDLNYSTVSSTHASLVFTFDNSDRRSGMPVA